MRSESDIEISALCQPGGCRHRERTAVRAIRWNEDRLERRFAPLGVQTALLPTELPKRFKGVDVAARFEPAYELGGDLYDFLTPEPQSLVIAVGDVSGKGVPAALYSAFAGELVRSRTFRRRYTTDRSSPAGVLASMNSSSRAATGAVLLHAVLRAVRLETEVGDTRELGVAVSRPLQWRNRLANRAPRRTARIVCGLLVRRGVVRSRRRRRVCVLHGRRLRSDRLSRSRLRCGQAHEGRPRLEQAAGPNHRRIRFAAVADFRGEMRAKDDDGRGSPDERIARQILRCLGFPSQADRLAIVPELPARERPSRAVRRRWPQALNAFRRFAALADFRRDDSTQPADVNRGRDDRAVG